ncbi:MAG: lipid II:glycine glycyltransferase FemX [Candidatus Saccharicenans sp.]
MKIKIIDPCVYPEWDLIASRYFSADIFHTAEWCRVLKSTYNFSPIYFLALEDKTPVALIPLTEVRSLLNGNRAISLPFSDFCHFLANPGFNFNLMMDQIINYGRQQKWRYVEFRSMNFPGIHPAAQPSEIFFTHDIDLTKSSSELWSSLKDNNRRNIKKAMRTGLKIKFESSWQSMKEFYRLQVITRKRHGLPPQPLKFFQSVHDEIILKNLGTTVSCYYQNKIIASAIFFNFNGKALFKFGASDHRYHHLRPNNLIMWESIQWHREHGCTTLNLGRTELNNEGLLNYKRLWGAHEQLLKYHRFDFRRDSFVEKKPFITNLPVFSSHFFPEFLLKIVGNLLYKHFS